MATTPSGTPERPPSPPVIDRVPKPTGLLPRHTQTWVLVGLASVMILIIAFTGQSPAPRSSVTPPPAAVDPNEARIQEYRNRIDEQARRLAAEQSQLAITKQALAQSSASAPTRADAAGGGSAGASAEGDLFEQDLRQREYRSLFADNLALTLRESTAHASAPPPISLPEPPQAAEATRLTQQGSRPPAGPALPPLSSAVLPPAVQPPTVPTPTLEATPTAPTSVTPSMTPPPATLPAVAAASPASTKAPATPPAPPPGQFRLLEGTVIETVLTTRLDGTFAGPVTCLVTTPVYTSDYQRVLIPRGSRLLGTATPVAQLDQQRLAVTFHRLLLPDGRTVPLDRAPGLDQIGQTGLRDQVDHHTLSILGATLAVGSIAGLAQVNTRLGYDAAWTDAYRQGVSGSVAQSSLRILDRFLNRLPTVTIREGHRVKVYLTGDLDLPPYPQTRAVPAAPPMR